VSDHGPLPQSLGRYRVIRRLGAGGMAEVFLARQTGAEGIEKVLVVKRVLPTFARSAKFRTMFIDEAKVALRLNHPNIVQVYAFEQVREEFLLAMELVDGLDLGRLVAAAKRADRRIPYGLAAYVIAELAKGLDYAHNRKDEQGQPLDIVHRDVSPQNVLLSFEGAVKVADFGIARARMVSEETGVIKGKFAYMSPEQARGAKVDRRSDVYSIGVLLAELLMARAMYPGQAGLDVLDLVRDGKRTLPRDVDPNVPEVLNRIVKAATALDVEERPQSARALASLLINFLHAEDDLWDGAALEAFISEIAPRETTSPDRPQEGPREGEGKGGVTALTVVAGGERGAEKEVRERRHVVVISGIIRGTGTLILEEGSPSVPLPAEGVAVLDKIAFRADAVLRWPDEGDRRRFRMLVGLGQVTVHDALKSAQLALDVVEAIQALSADLVRPVQASVGISRGVMAVVRSHDGVLLRSEPVGAVLELADKLAFAAETGEILTAGEVYRATRRDFAFAHEPRDVAMAATEEGERVQRAYALRGRRSREDRAAEASLPGATGMLIGRSREVAAVVDAFQEAVQSRRSVVMELVGELGVGKTSLAAAAIDSLPPDAEGRRVRVLRIECAFGAGDVPYLAAGELIREACGIPRDISGEPLAMALRGAVSRMVPGLEDRESVLGAVAPLLGSGSERRAEEGEDRMRAVVHAVRRLLGALGMTGPLVVVIDALQWIDQPSLELMQAVVRRSYEIPLFVLLGTRPDARVDKALDGVPRLELGELDKEGRLALVRARFSGAQVPADVEQAVIDRAGGNPFFVIELVDALFERGIVSIEGAGAERRVVRKPGPIALPTTLEGAIGARLAELPSEERQAIRWLAVVGGGVRGSDLAAVAAKDLTRALQGLESRGLVERRAEFYVFPSAVVRHVAYESTDLDDRRRMHRRIGAHLATMDGVPAARIARHLERAGDHAGAAEAYLGAGAAALHAFGTREALRLYGKALALLPPEANTRFVAHEAREQILRGAGRRTERRIELESMRAIADRSGDPRLRGTAFNRLARYELEEGRTAGVEALLRRALDAAIDASDQAAEVEALRLSAQLASDSGDVPKALDACDRALLRSGRDTSQLPVRGDVLVQRGMLLRRLSRTDESVEALAEAIVIFRRVQDKREEANALNALGVTLLGEGAFEDSIALFRASIALDRSIGDVFHLGKKLSNIGQLYAELGDTERALAFLRRADDVFEALDDKTQRADALVGLAHVLLEQTRDPEGAERALDRARQHAERTGDRFDLAQERVARVSVDLARGRLEGALRHADEAVSESRAAGVVGFELQALALQAHTFALAGRPQEARTTALAVRAGLARTGAVERVERIHYWLSLAFGIIGDNGAAQDALAAAREIVSRRSGLIRDSFLRERYVGSAIVQAIRA
jgi:tetratricopeptide (TPR) repeat protein